MILGLGASVSPPITRSQFDGTALYEYANPLKVFTRTGTHALIHNLGCTEPFALMLASVFVPGSRISMREACVWTQWPPCCIAIIPRKAGEVPKLS